MARLNEPEKETEQAAAAISCYSKSNRLSRASSYNSDYKGVGVDPKTSTAKDFIRYTKFIIDTYKNQPDVGEELF